jgi:hypothetical protein
MNLLGEDRVKKLARNENFAPGLDGYIIITQSEAAYASRGHGYDFHIIGKRNPSARPFRIVEALNIVESGLGLGACVTIARGLPKFTAHSMPGLDTMNNYRAYPLARGGPPG